MMDFPKLIAFLWSCKKMECDDCFVIFLCCRLPVFCFRVIINMYFTGVKGVQVEELWSLDAEQFENLKYVCFLMCLCYAN